jgi:hypothetical protein
MIFKKIPYGNGHLLLSQATKSGWLSIITNRQAGHDTKVYQDLFGKHRYVDVWLQQYVPLCIPTSTSIFKLLLAAS